jgi:diacylglycerol kinase (ATP)
MAGSRSDRMFHHPPAAALPFRVHRELRMKHRVPSAPNHKVVGSPFALAHDEQLPERSGARSSRLLSTATTVIRFLTRVARDMKQIAGDQPVGFFASRCASFGHAFRGLAFVIRSEPNTKIHLVATLAVVGAGLYFDLSVNEWCSISLVIGLVVATEILNTAIEELVDFVSPEHNASAGRVKDIAAAAALVAAGCAAVVGVFVFGPRLLSILNP